MTQEEIIASLRDLRDLMLAKSDWTQLSDSPLSVEDKTLWASYRQALRDLPQNTDLENLSQDLNEVVWPSEPE